MEESKDKKETSPGKVKYTYKMTYAFFPGDNQPNLLSATYPIRKHQHDSIKRQLFFGRKHIKLYDLPFFKRIKYLFHKKRDYGMEIVNLGGRNLFSFRIFAEKKSDIIVDPGASNILTAQGKRFDGLN